MDHAKLSTKRILAYAGIDNLGLISRKPCDGSEEAPRAYCTWAYVSITCVKLGVIYHQNISGDNAGLLRCDIRWIATV